MAKPRNLADRKPVVAPADTPPDPLPVGSDGPGPGGASVVDRQEVPHNAENMPPSGILPVSPDIWKAFASWFPETTWRPVWSPNGVYVVVDGTLVVGIPLFPTEGPYALATYAAVNPLVQEAIAGQAVHAALQTIQRWATVAGKYVFFESAHPTFRAFYDLATIWPGISFRKG